MREDMGRNDKKRGMKIVYIDMAVLNGKISPRFTGRCLCGNLLEKVWSEEHQKVFWNCFRCFPHHGIPIEEKKESYINAHK